MRMFFFFFQAEDGIRDSSVTGVQTCALPIFGELNADVDRARNREGTEGHQFVERLTFEQLHGDENAAIVVFDDLTSEKDGMVEGGTLAGLAHPDPPTVGPALPDAPPRSPAHHAVS